MNNQRTITLNGQTLTLCTLDTGHHAVVAYKLGTQRKWRRLSWGHTPVEAESKADTRIVLTLVDPTNYWSITGDSTECMVSEDLIQRAADYAAA